jgi:hypothetical protein
MRFILVFRKLVLSGTPEEIVTELKDYSFDGNVTTRQYMMAVNARVKRIHGSDVELPVRDFEYFLRGLADLGEVELIEDSDKATK